MLVRLTHFSHTDIFNLKSTASFKVKILIGVDRKKCFCCVKVEPWSGRFQFCYSRAYNEATNYRKRKYAPSEASI